MEKLILSAIFLLMFIPAFSQNDNRTKILQDLENQQVNQQYAAQQVSQQVPDTGLTATLISASRLFRDKDDLTSVIIVIPADSVVTVLDSDTTYLHVVYQDLVGYIKSGDARINELQKVTEPAIAGEQKADVLAREEAAATKDQQVVKGERYQQEKTTEQDRYSYLVNKYGPDMASRIYGGKIWRGMNSEMVQDSWGSPRKINRVISGNRIKEEWIYRRYWLFFRNSTLVDWGSTNSR